MKVLVLIDWQNLFNACKDKVSLEGVFGEITRRALERGIIQEIRLFVPNYQLITSPWRLINQLQLKYGLGVDVCPALREGAEMDESYKDVVDFEVLRWIMNCIHPGIGPELIVFVSGDGHFIVAANEAKRRGKEVQFWVVDPDTASNVLLRNMPVVTIKPGILLGTEENPFLSTLEKATTGKVLDKDDKKRMNYLKKVGEFLHTMEKPATLEAEMNTVVQEIQVSFDIPERDARALLKALIILNVVWIHPITTHVFRVDRSPILFQWLQTTG